jgi:predicted DNA-binding transcriptional regulator AlpA
MSAYRSSPNLPRQSSKVLSFREWCQLTNVSERTGRRILQSGDGPPVLQLSARRIGIRECDNERWQQARIR